MGCHHLTATERESILCLRAQGYGIRKIAGTLNRSPSTVSRELRRNLVKGAYSAHEADKLYRLRRKRCRPTFKLEDKELQALLRARLEEGWSPEQIKGRESLEVSVNTIYRAVKSGRLSFEASKHLRRRGKPYKRKTRQDGRGHIKDTVSIELRPKEVEQRLDIGDWEIDTVLGKPGTGGLVTVVDRKTRLLPPAGTDVGSKDRGQDGVRCPGCPDPSARGGGVPQPDDRQRKGVCATQGSIRCLEGPCVLHPSPQPLGAWYE